MDHGGSEPLAVQILGKPFGSALGAGEDETAARFLGEQAVQHFLFSVGGNFKGLHAHIFEGFRVEPKASAPGSSCSR